MFCTKLKQSGILIFLICILFITSCAKRIKERLEAKPVITYVEKPAELLLQDANRF